MDNRFRAANESIARTARELDFDGWIPFVCECADDQCVEVIRLPVDEYQSILDTPGRFLAFPGHPEPE